MKRSLELRQKRAGIYEQVKGLLTKAEGEKRSLDTTEQESITKMEAEMESIRATYEAIERSENIERELAAAPNAGNPANENRATGRDSEEYRSAFWHYVATEEKRADLTVGTAGQAGYLAPTAFEASVLKYATQANVMRQICDVRSYNSDVEIPVKSVRATFAYIAEKGAYPEAAQTYIKTGLKAYKFGGVVKVTEEILNDSVVSLEAEVMDEINYGMPRLEESKFVAGAGTSEPTGFTVTAQTGVTTASATAITFDEVIGLFHALPIAYRNVGTWLMHDSVALYLRKLKNTVDGAYLWQPSVVADKPDMILGRPVRYTQDMDSAVTATKKTIAFGDFSKYRIADRTGLAIQRLNELYAGNGQIGFRVTRRNDGLLLIPEAIKLMVQHA